MSFLDVLLKYQSCDPLTGTFIVPRSMAEYARVLGVAHQSISRLYRRERKFSLEVARALVRTFPQAATDVTAAIERIERERAGLAGSSVS